MEGKTKNEMMTWPRGHPSRERLSCLREELGLPNDHEWMGWERKLYRNCTTTTAEKKKKRSPLPKEARYGLDQLRDVVFFRLPRSCTPSLPFLSFLPSLFPTFVPNSSMQMYVRSFFSSWVVTNKDAQSNYGGLINMNERKQSANTQDKRKKTTTHTTHHTPHTIPREIRCSRERVLFSFCGCIRVYDGIVWMFGFCAHNCCGCLRILTFLWLEITRNGTNNRRKEKAEYGYPECRESEVLSPGDVGEGRLKMSGGTRVSLCVCAWVDMCKCLRCVCVCVVTLLLQKGELKGVRMWRRELLGGGWGKKRKKKEEKWCPTYGTRKVEDWGLRMRNWGMWDLRRRVRERTKNETKRK